MITILYTFAKKYRIIHLAWVNFLFCNIYPNTVVKKTKLLSGFCFLRGEGACESLLNKIYAIIHKYNIISLLKILSLKPHHCPQNEVPPWHTSLFIISSLSTSC